MHPASLDSICLLTVVFVCLYDTERILSAIAKFLFTSLGKGRDGEMGGYWVQRERVGR